MNILITGSSGFIGTNLNLYLLKKKVNVFNIDKKKNQYTLLKNFFKFDLININKLEEICRKKKIDIIINLAAISGVKNCHEEPNSAFKDNVISTYNVLQVAKKLKIKKVLLASSFAVNTFLKKPNFYGYTKFSAENMAYSFRKNYNLDVVVMRFSNVFGPYSFHKISAVHNFIKKSLSNKSFEIHGSGLQSRDFIYVLDLVKKIFNIIKLKKTKFKYNLNTSKKTNISNIIKALNKISNKENKTINVKPPPGYDIQPDKRSLNKKINKNLYNSLQKTYWWYSKNI